MGALQPVVGDILDGNIVTQTPPDDTYNNGTLLIWWSGFLSVVDLALACLIVIGDYNVIVGRYLGLRHSELAEFLPRLILAFAAAHFSMYFLGFFIDLENALCGLALGLAGGSILSNLIVAAFQGNLAGEGLLVWILGIVLGVMVILLGVQMAVRLALLWVLLVLAGPGLADRARRLLHLRYRRHAGDPARLYCPALSRPAHSRHCQPPCPSPHDGCLSRHGRSCHRNRGIYRQCRAAPAGSAVANIHRGGRDMLSSHRLLAIVIVGSR